MAPPTLQADLQSNLQAEIPPEKRETFRQIWSKRIFTRFFYGVLVLAVVSGLGMVAISRLVPPVTLNEAGQAGLAAPDMAEQHLLGLRFQVPRAWPAPVLRDNNSFVVSPAGTSDTAPTAGPFVFVIANALKTLQADLAFRTDYPTPVAQLDALIESINIDNMRFRPAQPYSSAQYPAAYAFGFQRGNKLQIVLLNTGASGWIYVGTQSKEADYPRYEAAAFKPLVDSLTVDPGTVDPGMVNPVNATATP